MNEPTESVPVKLYRSAERLTVAAPMPGMEPSDITVEVTEAGRLILNGQGRGSFKGDKEVLRDEWRVGSYRRELELPDPVDAELGNVTYGNGVLVVVLPFAASTRAGRLTLDAQGRAWGERVGSAGHPVRARTTEEHLTAMAAVQADNGGPRRP
jgi:HSP20 family protein